MQRQVKRHMLQGRPAVQRFLQAQQIDHALHMRFRKARIVGYTQRRSAWRAVMKGP